MVETQNTQGNQTAEGVNAGDKQQTTSIIESADSAAQRLETATEALKRENDRRENILARERLGGRTNGAPQVETPKEIDPKEYAQLALRGKLPLKK